MKSFLIDEKAPLFQFSDEELNRQLPTDDLNEEFLIRQTATGELENEFVTMFFKNSVTHHCTILSYAKNIEERIFYIQKTATKFWNNTTLKHHLKSNLDQRQGKLTHNFQTTLSENSFRQKAFMAFKDEMLLDFIIIEDADEEPNERVLENTIVQYIKKFIMALRSEFSFIGNQHRLIIEDK